MNREVSRKLVLANHWMFRALRLFRYSPTLISRGLASPGKKAFLKRLVNTYFGDCINLSLVFGETRSPLRLRWLALRTVGTYLRNTALYSAPKMWRGFDVYNEGALERALALGKGVVVAGQHLGPQRYSFTEIGARGLQVLSAMTQEFIEEGREWLQRVERDLGTGPQVDAVRKLTLLAVEEPTCALKMMRALRRQQAVMFDLDGNIGVGGEERTLQGSMLLTFLGRQVHVRHGVAYLGYRSGAPILPVISLWGRRGRPELHYFEPIVAHEGESLEKFTERCLEEVYSLLAAAVLEQPEQWEMWPHFYKWLRSPERLDPSGLERETEKLLIELERSPQLPVGIRPNSTWVMRIRGRYLLVDMRSFRFFFVSPATRKLLKHLSTGSTLERVVRQLERSQPRDMTLRDLARFRLLNLMESPLAGA